MDLDSLTKLSGVVTQGRGGSRCHSQWVTSYKVRVSDDGMSWSDVDGGNVFSGNTGCHGNVENKFASLVETRFVRIVVQTWNRHISMRSGVILCQDAATMTSTTEGGAGHVGFVAAAAVQEADGHHDYRYAGVVAAAVGVIALGSAAAALARRLHMAHGRVEAGDVEYMDVNIDTATLIDAAEASKEKSVDV